MDINSYIGIISINTNGNPTRLRELRDYFRRENEKRKNIWVFNDIRTHDIQNIRLDDYKTTIANRQENRNYAGGCAILTPPHG